MLFSHNGKYYELTFSYDMTKHHQFTVARLYEIVIDSAVKVKSFGEKINIKNINESSITKRELSQGIASKWYKDQFNKAYARKTALTYCLNFVGNAGLRAATWDAYIKSGARLP